MKDRDRPEERPRRDLRQEVPSSVATRGDDAQTGAALFIVPAPTASCPAWARWALGSRAAATVTGSCPVCGESVAVTVDPFDARQAVAGFMHESSCPAADPRLQELGEDDVELRVIVVPAALREAAA